MNAPKFITYKELMLVYGLNLKAAEHKLSVIRSVLGKKRYQYIHIAEFCVAENIDQQIFETVLQKEINRIYKNSPQITLNFQQ